MEGVGFTEYEYWLLLDPVGFDSAAKMPLRERFLLCCGEWRFLRGEGASVLFIRDATKDLLIYDGTRLR